MPEILNSRYYPTLASIVDAEDIPDILGFVKDGVITVLGKIHYKDLQYSKSPKGDAAFYSLSVVTKKRLDFLIPGTGIYFVLNPDLGSNPDFKVSVFPITLNYEWKILAYIRGVNLADFTESPQEIFELAMQVLNISQEQVMAQFINVFTEPVDGDTTPLQQYVNDVNAEMGTSIAAPTDDTTLREVNETIYSDTDDLSSFAGFKTYINVEGDLDETKIRLRKFFRSLLPNDIEEYIKDLLLPKIRTTLTLGGGLEFPRNILKPVYEADGSNPFDEADIGDASRAFTVIPGDEDENPKVMLGFGEVEFYADTDRGFGYNLDLALTSNVPAQIGNTDLILSVSGLKVDLREDTNIPEADADGRSNLFKGVFVETALVAFPNIFNPDAGNTATIIARNLLIGSEGGLSGTIGIETAGDNVQYLNFVPTVERDADDNVIGFSGFSFNAATKEMSINGNKKSFDDIGELDDVLIEDFKVHIPASGVKLVDAENQHFDIAADGTITAIDPPAIGLLQFTLFDNVVTINDFYLTFSKNKVVSSSVTGTIFMPGPDITLDMEIDFENGFRIHFSAEGGLDVISNSLFTLTLEELELGRMDEKFFLGVVGSLKNELEIPFVNKFVPNQIDFNPIKWVESEGIDYNLLLNWKNGLSLGVSNESGSPQIETTRFRIPFNEQKEGGLFKIDAIDLTLRPIDGGIGTDIALRGATINFKDVFILTIDGLGAKVSITEDESGNVSPFNVGFDLIPPKGIGIAIDAKAIKGGGYLYLDFEEGRYVGVGQLNIKDKVSLTVIGIITTKLPSGEKKTSVLLMVSAEFSPIQLSFGFTLNGVGGLVGINRGMNLQALRDGVKTKAIDNILFPDDPVGNISEIITDLEAVFPIQEGRYVFGVMGLIGWGTPTLIDIELGLMLEVPSPIRLAILGVIKSKLPTDENDLLKLQVNFVGTVDFEKKLITFDASIYESSFVKFSLAGDMAFRLKWGDDSNFLLSVGGFHPAYTPPPLSLPDMQRLTINLLGEDNPRLTLSTYFAITSNTVQIGAGIDFYYQVTKNIQVVGGLGFDVLIQFSPFYLRAELYAMLSVTRNGNALMAVSLYGMLEGPSPWHAVGKAEFTVAKLKLKANFDKTFGEPDEETLPDVDVMPLLIDEANKNTNWRSEFPQSSNLSVTLRKEIANPEELILNHPNTSPQFDQKLVPLNTPINKFGKKVPSGYKQFSINLIDDGGSVPTTKIKELFPPAEYIALSDSEKLARKSFEKMDSGIKVSGLDAYKSAAVLSRPVNYEHVVYDSIEDEGSDVVLDSIGSAAFSAWVNNGAASKSDYGTRKKPASNFAPAKAQVSEESFAIANLDDLTVAMDIDEPLVFGSEAEARFALEDLIMNNPALEDKVDVVLEHELV